MAHHPLADRQTDAGARHVGAERVAESVRVCVAQLVVATAVAEQTSQSRRRHRLPSVLSLEDDEELLRRGRLRALEVQVPSQQSAEQLENRHRPLLPALASDPQPELVERHVSALEEQDLERAQAAEQQQVDDRQIAVPTDAANKLPDLPSRERLDQRARKFHTQRHASLRPK